MAGKACRFYLGKFVPLHLSGWDDHYIHPWGNRQTRRVARFTGLAIRLSFAQALIKVPEF